MAASTPELNLAAAPQRSHARVRLAQVRASSPYGKPHNHADARNAACASVLGTACSLNMQAEQPHIELAGAAAEASIET
jgi:hypothetical protein